MAEVDTGGGGGGKHKGGPKQKKKSTKIDMTAMVDVAFLLLTFFILTTTMASPSAMKLHKPPKNEDQDDVIEKVKQSKIMTMILGEKDQVHYYQGLAEDAELKTVDFSATGIRKAIQDHINHGREIGKPLCTDEKGEELKNCWDPIFIIKANKTSKFKNFVDLLDEIKINQARKYAIVDIQEADSLILLQNNKR